MNENVSTLAAWIQKARRIVFFGGAGVSTESGIPDFRSAHGVYRKAHEGRSYEEMLSIQYFARHPDEFWTFYRSVMLYPDAKPNAAHLALARLEQAGKLSAVVTQNIDELHQRAGSRHVLELHGTVYRNSCTRCGKVYNLRHILDSEGTPHCDCGGLLRPDIVMYGEALDDDVMEAAVRAIRECDLLLVGGTSLVVYPAAGLLTYRRPGTKLALINRDSTSFDEGADLVIRENIAQVLDEAIPK